jgi:hypothetical protein
MRVSFVALEVCNKAAMGKYYALSHSAYKFYHTKKIWLVRMIGSFPLEFLAFGHFWWEV